MQIQIKRDADTERGDVISYGKWHRYLCLKQAWFVFVFVYFLSQFEFEYLCFL